MRSDKEYYVNVDVDMLSRACARGIERVSQRARDRESKTARQRPTDTKKGRQIQREKRRHRVRSGGESERAKIFFRFRRNSAYTQNKPRTDFPKSSSCEIECLLKIAL